MPYSIGAFAGETYVFSVLKLERASDIINACIAEMRKSLSPYACAVKSLFGAKTNANIPIDVNQKCL